MLWYEAWNRGVAPLLSTEGLEALRDALRFDEDTLIQGATTQPPPLACVQDWPVEACCAISYCGWKGNDLATVGEVEEFFARLCFEADNLLGEPGGIRYFLNWYDDTPRKEMRIALLKAIEITLYNRTHAR